MIEFVDQVNNYYLLKDLSPNHSSELLGIDLAATPEIHHVFNYDTHNISTPGENIYSIRLNLIN